MLETQSDTPSPEAEALVVVWASTHAVRCVLAPLDGSLELRLEHDGKVIRRGRYVDVRPACDAARRWRADWDHRDETGPHLTVSIPCSECGDDALAERDRVSGVQWLRCRSCGEAWTADGAGERAGD